MAKFRVLFFLTTLIVVSVLGTFASYYARGYRLNLKTLKFQPNGILVVKSEPDGASIYINGELKSATNATISISPGTYDVEVKKDGFFTWYKRLVVEKEIVTQANVSLFKQVPSLSPITFSGAVNPVASNDGTKIAYSVLPSKNVSEDKVGLWTVDTYNFPLGFSNNEKRVTDGDLTNASYSFSPDGRQIILTTSNSISILESTSFTAQANRVNITGKQDSILKEWAVIKKAKEESLTRNLPPQLTDILGLRSSNVVFSPDENMIMYTASTSGTLPEKLIPQLPGSSTQKQERNTLTGHTYVYDIKEDRNFLVGDKTQTLRWMPDSRHLLLLQPNQIVIMDYDGTNKQVVYSGSYIAPNGFPFTNATKLLILTNLGATTSSANLYTLTVK
ncbi:MAG TPA: PEGA domain-containing protein [Patescibacteria group bacterium]|nr:PEGA domain-containing protein [Patescibacteria group bacterium]